MLGDMRWRALSFDLDDTLWPIAPVMERAEQRLDAWLATHCPRAHQHWPADALRALRDQVYHAHPELHHDFTATRLLCLRAALEPHGYGEDAVQAAYWAFYAARNEVALFPEVTAALERLAARYRLIAISNGNADLERIGLAAHFEFSLHAREHGAAKPSRCIFDAAARRLQLPAEQILHVGDHPEHDVAAAKAAGMGAVWMDRGLGPAAEPIAAPRVENLDQLCAWLDQHNG
jgi:FMN hydrolase / 5-amino-6-(5-phospho-D-ribitylamino)uracil phosphatase